VLRVLLFSPLPGRDPLSGDTSYTAALLQHPPDGVRYTTYAQALEDGTLTIRGRRPRRGHASALDTGLFLARGAEALARRSGLAFREPTWFITVDTQAFDLVHAHLFPLSRIGGSIPIVSSAGYPLRVLYANRERWSRVRIARAEWLERVWSRFAGVHNPWLHHVPPSTMTVYSEAARGYLIANGAPPSRVRIVGTALPPLPLGRRSRDGRSVLFVGRDFDMKGGPLALEAVRRLRRSGHHLNLTVVTSSKVPRPAHLDASDTWLIDVDRDTLLSEVLPRADVLLAPTHSDCGVPYAVLEALQAGVAVVLSDLEWLDPRPGPPAVRRVARDVASIVAALEELLDPESLRTSQAAARALWESRYTMTRLGEELRRAYLDEASAS
jgi:glycosyltransferase involved in cell wall biosynthesis